MSDLSSSSLHNSSPEQALGASLINNDSLEAASTEVGSSATKESADSKKPRSALVDWDYKGRVVRARFSDGHIAQFRYDESGDLYGLVYARLAWSTHDGSTWTAQDSANTYITEGRITVNLDGSLTIVRDGFSRTLKLDGTICDDYGDGQVLETQRTHKEHKPADLLAESRRKNGVVTTQDFDIPSWLKPESEKRMVERSFSPAEKGLGEIEKVSPDRITDKASPDRISEKASLERVELTVSNDTHSEPHAAGLLQNVSVQYQVEPAPHSSLVDSKATGDSASPSGAESDRRSAVYESSARLSTDKDGTQSKTAEPIDETPSQSTASNGRRPLAVGKRVNKLRVLDEEAARSAATITTPPTSTTDSVRLAYAQLRLAALEKLNGPNHLTLVGCLDTMAEICLKRRRVNDAREAHERALRIRRQHLGSSHADTSINLLGLGKIFHEWGRYTEAEDMYAQAIRISGQGLQKARFMRESGLTDDVHILQHIERLFSALHCLSTLYSEQKRRHLCAELLATATNVRNSLDSVYVQHFEPIFSAMTQLASIEKKNDEPAAAYMRKPKAIPSLGS